LDLLCRVAKILAETPNLKESEVDEFVDKCWSDFSDQTNVLMSLLDPTQEASPLSFVHFREMACRLTD
jgi:hypothetical protein